MGGIFFYVLLRLRLYYYIKSMKISKKGVDMGEDVRYNGGSLSKSPFVTSTKRNEKRGNLLRSLWWLQNYSLRLSINNLETIKILKTERVIVLSIAFAINNVTIYYI